MNPRLTLIIVALPLLALVVGRQTGHSAIVSNVTATASSELYYVDTNGVPTYDRRAVYASDGSGLCCGEPPGHANNNGSVWESVGVGFTGPLGIPGGDDPQPWIQFNFPGLYPVASMSLWNFGEPERAVYRAEIIVGSQSLGVFVFQTNHCWDVYCSRALRQTIPFSSPVMASSVKLRILENGGGIPYPLTNPNTQTGLVSLVGLGEVQFNLPEPVSIVAQPRGATNPVGSTICFSVGTTGAAPMTFQWRRNGLPISNSQTSQLCLTNVQLADEGTYDVIVCNIVGCQTSTQAMLKVLSPPVFIQQPTNVQAPANTIVTFECAAIGREPIHYQWFKENQSVMNTSRITGATTSQLRIAPLLPADAGGYYVVATNSDGRTSSWPVLLQVDLPPTFVQQPASQKVIEGTPVIYFQSAATGAEPIAYQWYREGSRLTNSSRISGAQSYRLGLGPVQTSDAGIYLVVASNLAGSTSSLPAILEVVSKPHITKQPTGGAKQVGEPMVFTVEATGTLPFTYQWYKDSTPLIEGADPRISGVNLRELKIQWVQTTDTGNYWVRVCNEGGCTNSQSATLVPILNLAGPGFLETPTSRTNIAGTTAIFSAHVWGSYPLTNQWRKNGQPLGNPIIISGGPNGGANPVGLVLTNVQPADAGDYDIVVSNPAGSVTSLPATLTVVTNPMVTVQPQSKTIMAGATTNFTINVIGPTPLTYQWRREGNPLSNGGRITGATSTTLAITAAEIGDAGGYDVIVANSYGSVTSAVATLTVVTAPTITAQPQSRTNFPGTTATFTVVATGSPPLIYQWRKGALPMSNSGTIAGVDTPTLTLTAVVESDAGSYDVMISNSFGTNTSSLANLSIHLPPHAPSGLTAVSSQPTRVTLNWTDNATNETSFRIERSSNGVSFSEINFVGANVTSFNDNTVQPGTHYHYRVRAANGTGFSPFSNVAEVTTGNAGLSILPETLPVDWILGRPDETYATSQIVAVTGQPFATALRVSTLRKPTNAWEVQVTVPTDAPVASNDLLRAVYYLRQVQAQPGGEAQAAFLFQRAGTPWETSGYFMGVEHLGEWRRYEFLFRAADSYPAGVAQGAFQLGHDTQIIEIGGVTVEHYAHATNPPSLIPAILPYGWNFQRPNASHALSQIVPVIGQPFTNAIRITTLQRPAFQHEVQLNIQTIAPAASNAPIFGVFYLRRAGSTGTAQTAFVFERSTSPWDKSAYLSFSEATGDWQRFQTVFPAHNNFAAGGAQLNFQLGFDPQSIEIGGVSLTVIMAPLITAQPLPPTAIVGGTATFTVTAVAAAQLHYQWRKGGIAMTDGGRISGVNAPTLSLTEIEPSDVADYEVVITNIHGTATSDAVTLVLESAPTITSHPQSTNATAGDVARFAVMATGTAPLNYRWRKNSTPLSNGGKITGADAIMIEIANVGLADIGNYDVVVSNHWGTAISGSAFLAVNVPPSVGIISVGNPGEGVSLQFNGNPGECSLVLMATNLSGPWQIAATIVYGPDGTASFLDDTPPVSQAFYRTELLSGGLPTIQTHPVSLQVTAGNSFSFRATAASCSPLSYQWRKNGQSLTDDSRITGSGSNHLVVSNAQFSDAGDYDLRVMNASGAVASQVAVLTVVGGPVIGMHPVSQTNVPGSTAQFFVGVSGTAPLGYQWRKGGTNLTENPNRLGVRSPTLVINNLSAVDAGEFDVVVTNGYGSITSHVATLTVRSQSPIVDFLDWYRADSSQFSALSDGQAITNWMPEIGSTSTPGCVQIPGYEILYRSSVAGLNGMPALEFPGGLSIITNIANLNFSGVSVFLVFKNIGSGGLQRAVAGETSNMLLGPWLPGAYHPVIHVEGVWKIHPGDVTNWTNASPCVLSIVVDDVSLEKSFINGVEINSTFGGAGPIYTGQVGKLSFNHLSEPYRGYISEFIIYRRVLSDTEILDVHNYLLAKYGINQ